MPYTCAEDLKEAMGLSDAGVDRMNSILDQYPMLISEYYYSLIDFDDPNDPILKMAVPSVDEMDVDGSFDTSGEASNTLIPGLQHKYRETAIILSTNKCAMYCRHCFRKRLVGLTDDEIAEHLDEIFAYIAAHKEISNVLISGGDAFMNGNETIKKHLRALTAIDHLDLIRLATRTPVTLPMRITEDDELLGLLASYGKRKKLYVVTQFNHPREITPQAASAVQALLHAGCVVRNQTVLLRGVNDDAAVLSELFRGLTAIGCLPYYVFQCRPVKGVKNQFQVPLMTGIEIVESAKAHQSGMGKSFKYCLSHPEGKLEIIGLAANGEMLLKYHEAKDPKKCGRILSLPLLPDDCWLPETL